MRGHIARRGSTWTVYYDRPRDPVSGRRRKTSKGGFHTKKEAERWFANLVTDLGQGSYVEANKQTLGEFLEEWLPGLETRGLRPSTRRIYRMLIRKQIVPRLGRTPLQGLTPMHLNGLYAELLASGRTDGKGGLSPKSVRHVHMVLRRSLADAVRWNRLQRNPADLADPPSSKAVRAPEMNIWSAQELRAFLSYVESEPLYAAFFLAATTGMRRGEVLGLPWRDFDLDAGRLSVTQTLIAPDYQVQFSQPKTAKGRRTVELDPATVEVMRSHKKAQLEERLAFGPGYEESDLVFRQADGSLVHPHQFSQLFQQRAKDAGLPKIRLHDLRHTYATLALKAGEHPKVVSERLGHSSVSITLDVYSHAVPGLQKESAARVAALILGH